MRTLSSLFTLVSLLLMSVGTSRSVSEGREVIVLLTDGSKRVDTMAHVGFKEIVLNGRRAATRSTYSRSGSN